MQGVKAHGDPNHHCRHLRRPCPLDERHTLAHDGGAETVTKNSEAAISKILSKSLIVAKVDRSPGATFVSHAYAEAAFTYAYKISGTLESKPNAGNTHLSGVREQV
jgi:hypothetical protein